MKDVLDEATDDMYAFLASLDSGYVGYVELVVDPSRFADLLYRYRHSHGETTAHPLYPNNPMPAVDPSRFLADRQYRHHHSHGESALEASLIPSDHMKYVWKLIEWENGEATIESSMRRRPGTSCGRFFLSRTIG
jgi:hypothetical protein